MMYVPFPNGLYYLDAIFMKILPNSALSYWSHSSNQSKHNYRQVTTSNKLGNYDVTQMKGIVNT